MPKRNRPAPAPILVFTGRRHRSRIEVRLNDDAVPLTVSSFELLLELVLALGATETGYLPHEAVAVRRLRAAIDKITKKGTGAKLIETGMSGQYRLTIPLSEIALTSCFFELVDLKIVSQADADMLRTLLRIV